MSEKMEGNVPPQEHEKNGQTRDAEGKIYRTVPLSAEEIQAYNEEGWGPKESLVKVEVSSDDGKSWGSIAGRVSPEEAAKIIDDNVQVVDNWQREREDREQNTKKLEAEGFDLTGYMDEGERRDGDRVWYFGGYYEPDSSRLKIGNHPWVAYDGVHKSAFESPAEAKKWIKEQWDYAHKQ
jgi:hypothetical protein